MPYMTKLDCCGVKEIAGVSSYTGRPEACLLDLMSQFVRDARDNQSPYCYVSLPAGYFLFTEARRPTPAEGSTPAHYGQDLAAYIEQEKLGAVHLAPIIRNPNSGNFIQTYLWAIDHTAFTAWWEAKRPPELAPQPGEHRYSVALTDGQCRWNSEAVFTPRATQPTITNSIPRPRNPAW